MIQPLWKTIWRFLKKLGIKPPYDPAIPLLGVYPEETKIEKDTSIPLCQLKVGCTSQGAHVAKLSQDTYKLLLR